MYGIKDDRIFNFYIYLFLYITIQSLCYSYIHTCTPTQSTHTLIYKIQDIIRGIEC